MSDTKHEKKNQNQTNRTSVLLQSKSYLGSKNGKALSDKSKQPLLSAFLSFLFHIRTVTERNFLNVHFWNSAPLSTPMLGARDLDKETSLEADAGR